MLNKSIMFYQNAEEIKKINKNLNHLYTIPNLDAPIEPFLVTVDQTLKNYLSRKIEFDKFLKKIFNSEFDFIKKLKFLNKKNQFLNNLIYEKKNNPTEKIEKFVNEKYGTIFKKKSKNYKKKFLKIFIYILFIFKVYV